MIGFWHNITPWWSNLYKETNHFFNQKTYQNKFVVEVAWHHERIFQFMIGPENSREIHVGRNTKILQQQNTNNV